MSDALLNLCLYFIFQEEGLDQKQSRPRQISDNNGHIFINLLPNFRIEGYLRLAVLGPLLKLPREHQMPCFATST